MKLEAGRVYELDGKPWRCVMVNWCRARLVPGWKEERTLTDRDGRERTFVYTPSKGISVSSHSDIRVWR